MSQEDRDKWNARYQDPECLFRELQPPHEFIVAHAKTLPASGTALDIAGGVGRHAIWLAQQGLDVTLLDISAQGLHRAEEFAKEQGVTLRLLEHDAADDGIPPGAWDVIVSSYFLRRDLFLDYADHLNPGGLLIYLQPTAANLERHAKPPRDFLLDDAELPGLVQGLEIISYEERWFGEPAEDARHEARLVAQKK